MIDPHIIQKNTRRDIQIGTPEDFFFPILSDQIKWQ